MKSGEKEKIEAFEGRVCHDPMFFDGPCLAAGSFPLTKNRRRFPLQFAQPAEPKKLDEPVVGIARGVEKLLQEDDSIDQHADHELEECKDEQELLAAKRGLPAGENTGNKRGHLSAGIPGSKRGQSSANKY